ncbi:DUF2269 family protein [Ahrensia sp. 13_GOM-1096m]|uniref:DUF2269 family protein n=1 Tax=Ahrensia sp. 13_GOM-1096m TaxID=1380380 RepID=UPI00047E6FB1|nr:DUF2269 family protein [Ahrensia sp. 13_GOM-1096m]
MPDLYLSAKLIHFLAVIVMVGATIINGLIHGQAKAATPLEASALLKAVLSINRLLMAPSLVLIPISGYALMVITGYGLADKWLLISLVLSISLIAAYLLGLRLEQRLHIIATQSSTQHESTLPKSYNSTFTKAVPIGSGALVMSIAALVLMIFKPF